MCLFLFQFLNVIPSFISVRVLKIHKHFLDYSLIFIAFAMLADFCWLSFFIERFSLCLSFISPWMVVSTPSPQGPLFRTRYYMGSGRVLPSVLLNRSQA